jgi:hypothetical protein
LQLSEPGEELAARTRLVDRRVEGIDAATERGSCGEYPLPVAMRVLHAEAQHGHPRDAILLESFGELEALAEQE